MSLSPDSGQTVVSRAHRRFLGLAVPLPAADELMSTLQAITFAPGSQSRFNQHLATAGVPRSGLLIGHRAGDRLHVQAILGAGYGGAPHALHVEAQYALGAVDAAQRLSHHPVDWVGTWVMAADGRAHPEAADLPLWHRARALALVSDDAALVTVGHTPERLVVRAWCGDDGPRALDVVWAAAGDAS